jgi:hypothetical protein
MPCALGSPAPTGLREGDPGKTNTALGAAGARGRLSSFLYTQRQYADSKKSFTRLCKARQPFSLLQFC